MKESREGKRTSRWVSGWALGANNACRLLGTDECSKCTPSVGDTGTGSFTTVPLAVYAEMAT